MRQHCLTRQNKSQSTGYFRSLLIILSLNVITKFFINLNEREMHLSQET